MTRFAIRRARATCVPSPRSSRSSPPRAGSAVGRRAMRGTHPTFRVRRAATSRSRSDPCSSPSTNTTGRHGTSGSHTPPATLSCGPGSSSSTQCSAASRSSVGWSRRTSTGSGCCGTASFSGPVRKFRCVPGRLQTVALLRPRSAPYPWVRGLPVSLSCSVFAVHARTNSRTEPLTESRLRGAVGVHHVDRRFVVARALEGDLLAVR